MTIKTPENYSQLSSRTIPAYIECGKCRKHSEIDGDGGQMKCPQCGSTCIEQLEIGTGGKPSWFNESSTAIAKATVADSCQGSQKGTP